MLDLGIHVAGGSDGPCTAPNPIEGIYCACNHYIPGQSVTIAEALRMFTWEAAYLSFDEDLRGSLEVGKVADLTILNTDPFALAPNQLRSLKVEQLYLAGVPYHGKMGIGGLLFGLLSGRGKKRKI
jgi:predicted amidohydrolase YtcJ